MDTSRWSRLERLFHDALALPPEDREAFLEREAPDAGLRGEVRALLDADAAEGTLRPATPGDPDPGPAAGRALEGTRIGPYRVLRRIGEGGMGAVYLAERDDVEKEVALKLVRGALAAPELVQRFLLERRVLARLDHPYIARLLDAGVTEDETPYFALEYVEGEPITDHCRARDLPVADRLGLFRDVCEAVSYAHGNLVVHRDIKPSNVMVTRDGTVKLLDFGIAKLLGEDDVDSTLTRTGARVMSPAYAAPEQLAGEPATTATDVYSLGVLLYELLTGSRPGEVSGPGGARQDERRADPTRPSAVAARAGQRSRGRQLEGDLDAICLRAIAHEPARRYRSAEQLADDITRHLEGLPVEARLPTFRYRAGKFARRNAAALAGAAVLALSLGGGLGAAVWQGQRAERSREDAELARRESEVALERSRSVSDFLISLFQEADPRRSRGQQVTAVDLVERGMERIDELDHDPVLQALLLENLAHVNMQLGRYDEASALAGRAVDLRRPLPADSAFITALNAHGMMYFHRGLTDSAGAAFREAMDFSREILGEEHDETLALMNNLAIILGRLGRDAEAETVLRDIVRIERRVLPENAVRASALNNLGVQLANDGAFDEAEAFLREAVQVRREYGDERGEVDLAMALDNLGMALREAGRYDEAEPHLRQALDLRGKILGHEHRWFAASLYSLGTLLVLRDGPLERAEGVAMIRRAVDLFQAALGDDHYATAYAVHSLGLAAELDGDLQEAEARFRRALELRRSSAQDNALNTVKSLTALARVLHARGASEAPTVAEEAAALAAAELDADHHERAEAEAQRAIVRAASGEAGWDDDFTAAVSRLASVLGDQHLRVRRLCEPAASAGLATPAACRP